MSEHTFVEGLEADAGFDFRALLDEMRCQTNDSLRSAVKHARQEQTRWRLREVAATKILDEREALDALPDPTVSARTARVTLEVGRNLESQPEIAAAAHAGDLTWDQLQPLVELATPETDTEWARRGPRLAPVDLQRMARRQRAVTHDEERARHNARFVRMWREAREGMTGGRWRLPDVDGVLVEKVLDHMAERLRPPKGEPWDTRAHRRADALLALCKNYADVEPTGRFKYLVLIQQPVGGVPEVDGIPISHSALAALLPNAVVRDVEAERNGVPPSTKRKAIPADVERHVRARDLHCRTPGCEETQLLDLHHLREVCNGGGNAIGIHDVCAVCKWCHPIYEPHGPYRLVGDPEEPDGLRLLHGDEELVEARAGPAP